MNHSRYNIISRSDVICEFPLKEMLEFHRARKAEATVLVTRVADPSNFGVVVSDESGKVEKFVGRHRTITTIICKYTTGWVSAVPFV